MRRALAHALLVAGLALAAPVPAQFSGAPTPAVQADSHIFSAFTTRSDPHVLADNVALGPALRGQIGEEKDSRKIYDALMAGVAGKPVRSRSLSIGETVGYASLGVNSADPVVLVEADDVRLLMQYSIAQKNVAFVEQLAGTPVALPQAAPKPEPIVERPLPTEPPAAPRPSAAPVAAVPSAPRPAAPKPAQRSGPRGECVVKPVMSEDDLWNCSAPGQASSPQMGTPAPAAAEPAAATSALAAPATAQPRVECVVKPVMTEEDLRICAAASRSRPAAPMETAAPAMAVQPSAPAAPPAPRDCVIKPVMTEEDLRVCAAASKARPAGAMEVAVPVSASAAARAPSLQAPAPPTECVVKPVMTEEDLRICAAASRSRPAAPVETAAPATARAAQPSAPAAPAAPRDCVIKPVMSEEDRRACGGR